jgi:hypothetical protein
MRWIRPWLRRRTEPKRTLPGLAAAALADAIGLVEKVIAVAQRLLCVLVDRDCDRLDVLIAVALARGSLAQFGGAGGIVDCNCRQLKYGPSGAWAADWGRK